MDIYDSSYFRVNKRLLSCVGLWPFESSRKKIISRIFFAGITIAVATPHVIGLRVYFGLDIDRTLHHITVIIFCFMVLTKLISSALTENTMKALYRDIASNWQMITDAQEKEKLIEHSQTGRYLTLYYMLYICVADMSFLLLPLMPIILDTLKPLNESRPYIFILEGEFLIDRNENYIKLYFYDVATITMTLFVIVSVDTIYAACVEHCIGLFAILKYRLRVPHQIVCNLYVGTKHKHDVRCEWIIASIRLHKKVLCFKDRIETSYSSSLLVLMGLNIVHFSIMSVLIIINLDQYLNLIRYFLLLFGMVIHLFYLSWPGQKLIDYSSGLFRDAYINDWYEGSEKSKKLLKMLTLRCMEPCEITAGGLYVMNFQNFASVMKTSVSYVTVFASFR